MRLLFATTNKNKLLEARAILGGHWEVSDLTEAGWTASIEETATTFTGNALLKAKTVADTLETDCFAEDAGLEVFALEGRPGVYSARYAGPGCTSTDNVKKLLDEMLEIYDRRAQFRTVVALIIDGALYQFEGCIKGNIAATSRGNGGFGYDPVFIPEGYEETFGELPNVIKDRISHRARAMQSMAAFLKLYTTRKSPGSARTQK